MGRTAAAAAVATVGACWRQLSWRLLNCLGRKVREGGLACNPWYGRRLRVDVADGYTADPKAGNYREPAKGPREGADGRVGDSGTVVAVP